MVDVNCMRQISTALQPLLFAPRNMDVKAPGTPGWRYDEFKRRETAGTLQFSSESERQDALSLVMSASDDMTNFRMLQLMAFMLNGAATCYVSGADLEDSVLSDSMSYAAACRFDRVTCRAFLDAVEAFVSSTKNILDAQFGVAAKLSPEDLAKLDKMGLLRWE